jgi:hypothetical protein
MAPPPPKKLRWDRIILAIVLLAGIVAGAVILIKR